MTDKRTDHTTDQARDAITYALTILKQAAEANQQATVAVANAGRALKSAHDLIRDFIFVDSSGHIVPMTVGQLAHALKLEPELVSRLVAAS